MEYDTNLLNDIYPDSGTTGLKLAADCEWDGVKILEIAAVALTDANFHAQAAQVRQILEQTNHENAQADALFDVVFGTGGHQ